MIIVLKRTLLMAFKHYSEPNSKNTVSRNILDIEMSQLGLL